MSAIGWRPRVEVEREKAKVARQCRNHQAVAVWRSQAAISRTLLRLSRNGVCASRLGFGQCGPIRRSSIKLEITAIAIAIIVCQDKYHHYYCTGTTGEFGLVHLYIMYSSPMSWLPSSAGMNRVSHAPKQLSYLKLLIKRGYSRPAYPWAGGEASKTCWVVRSN